VSELAPFSVALVGAGAGEMALGELHARVLAPLAIAAGVLSEVLVIHNGATDMQWIVPLLVVVGVVAAFVLASQVPRRLRIAAVSVALGALLIAPASWAFDTLGHATSSTFPAGGPQSAAFGGGGGPGGAALGRARFAGGGPPTDGGAGGAFGADTSELSSALAYVNSHGGGTVAVSSQSGASASIIQSGAGVAGIGGFSGRESDVTVAWLKREISAGKIRWVLATGNGFGGGGFGADSRTRSQTAMSWVQQSCKAVSSVSGLYDCWRRAVRRGPATGFSLADATTLSSGIVILAYTIDGRLSVSP
jgi:4-amino-4-deoxy-L-arabinose transferase-like glycosyltransferase